MHHLRAPLTYHGSEGARHGHLTGWGVELYSVPHPRPKGVIGRRAVRRNSSDSSLNSLRAPTGWRCASALWDAAWQPTSISPV